MQRSCAASRHDDDVAGPKQYVLLELFSPDDTTVLERQHALAIALAASMTNIVSGFLITDRMLKMFKRPGEEKRP